MTDHSLLQKLEDIFTVTSLPPEKKVSHAEMDRQGGREYIERRKSRRKVGIINLICIF